MRYPLDLYSTDSKGRPIVRFGNFKVRYIGDPNGPPGLSHTPQATDRRRRHRADQELYRGCERAPGGQPRSGRPAITVEGDRVQRAELRPVGDGLPFRHAAHELNPNYRLPQENHDSDNDGVEDEVSEGNVSALTIFTMSIRPPAQQIPEGMKKHRRAGREAVSR